MDYPSYAAISGGLNIVEGRALEQPGDLVMDTILAAATGMRVGETLPMLNREFRLAGICRAGAGGRLYARIQDVQDAIGTPDKASFFLVKGRSALDAEKLAQALQEKFKGHKITPVAQVSQVMQDNAVGLKQFKQALTGMAVVISFLVVLLAMYTTIIERTREIGILRAIGASQAQGGPARDRGELPHLPGRRGPGDGAGGGQPVAPALRLPHPDRRAQPAVGGHRGRPSA